VIHHRVGLGRALHARRDVRRLAEDLAGVGNHHRLLFRKSGCGEAEAARHSALGRVTRQERQLTTVFICDEKSAGKMPEVRAA